MASEGVSTSAELGRVYDAWHLEHSLPDVDRRQRLFFEWILDLAAPSPDERLLDVACGNGAFLSVVAERGVEVHGIELSPVAIEMARKRIPDADLQTADAEELPYGDGTFDVVTCLGSLEHFPHPDRGAAEIARVLAPRGTAVVFVPNLFFVGHVWLGWRYGTEPSEGGQDFSESFLTSRGWIELLEASGLVVRRWTVWNRIHASSRVSPLTMWLWNVVSWLVPRNGAYAFAFVCSKANPS